MDHNLEDALGLSAQDILSRRAAAVDEFNRHENRTDADRVLESLSGGLTLLRDALFARSHNDVEHRLGMDSMLQPVSEKKTERLTKLEIELYQLVVTAGAVRERCYLPSQDDWFLHWLAAFRLGSIVGDPRVGKRLAYYQGKNLVEQRLAFSNVLAAIMPEARQAPMVLLLLVPPAVRITTALAFGRSADARTWRKEQVDTLPAILDCNRCRGKLLENGEQCTQCGNPLWKFEWLTAAD